MEMLLGVFLEHFIASDASQMARHTGQIHLDQLGQIAKDCGSIPVVRP